MIELSGDGGILPSRRGARNDVLGTLFFVSFHVFDFFRLDSIMMKRNLATSIAAMLAGIGLFASAVAATTTTRPDTVFAPPAQISMNYFTGGKDAGSIINMGVGAKEGFGLALAQGDADKYLSVDGQKFGAIDKNFGHGFGQASAQFGTKANSEWNSTNGTNLLMKQARAGQGDVGITPVNKIVLGGAAHFATFDFQGAKTLLGSFVLPTAMNAGTGEPLARDAFKKPAISNGGTRTVVTSGKGMALALPQSSSGGAQDNKSAFYDAGLHMDTHSLAARSYLVGGTAFKSPGTAV